MTTPNGSSGTELATLTPRQERLVALRDDMTTGARPGAIVPRNFVELELMCKVLAQAGLVPTQYRERPTDMIFTVMSGAELGLPPMASLRLYHNIEGKLSLGAEGIRAVILSSPDCEYFEFAESSPTRVVWIGKRPGRPEKSITWTIERAKQAGLTGKGTWTKSPEDLLNARASMQLGRLNWPNIMAGLISREELMDGAIEADVTESRPAFVAVPAPSPMAPPSIPPQLANTDVVNMPAYSPPKARAARAPRAPTPTPSQPSGAGASASAAGISQSSSTPSGSATQPSLSATDVVLDKWGQAVATVEGKRPTEPPAATSPSTASAADSSSVSDSDSSSGADGDDSGFGDEDPVDTTPAAVYDEAGFDAWLAGVTTQRQLVAEQDPWVTWSKTLAPAETQKQRAKYAARRSKLPA